MVRMISEIQPEGSNVMYSITPEYIVLAFILQQYNQVFKINNFHHLQLQYLHHSPTMIHHSFTEHAGSQVRKSVVDSQCYLVSWPTGPTHMHYKWVLHTDRLFLVITTTWCLYFATSGHISHRNGTEQNHDANFSCLFHSMYFIYI